jgi:hypothetical protein
MTISSYLRSARFLSPAAQSRTRLHACYFKLLVKCPDTGSWTRIVTVDCFWNLNEYFNYFSIGAVLCSHIVKEIFNVSMTLLDDIVVVKCGSLWQYTFMISYTCSLLIDLHDLHTADIIPPPIFMKVISCSIHAILSSIFLLFSCISSFLFVDTCCGGQGSPPWPHLLAAIHS